MDWIKNLKVGDTVIVRWWRYGFNLYQKCKVEKIEPEMFIEVAEYHFSPHSGKGRGFFNGELLNFDDESVRQKFEESQKEFEENQKELFTKQIVKIMYGFNSITYTQAQKIYEILKGK